MQRLFFFSLFSLHADVWMRFTFLGSTLLKPVHVHCTTERIKRPVGCIAYALECQTTDNIVNIYVFMFDSMVNYVVLEWRKKKRKKQNLNCSKRWFLCSNMLNDWKHSKNSVVLDLLPPLLVTASVVIVCTRTVYPIQIWIFGWNQFHVHLFVILSRPYVSLALPLTLGTVVFSQLYVLLIVVSCNAADTILFSFRSFLVFSFYRCVNCFYVFRPRFSYISMSMCLCCVSFISVFVNKRQNSNKSGAASMNI